MRPEIKDGGLNRGGHDTKSAVMILLVFFSTDFNNRHIRDLEMHHDTCQLCRSSISVSECVGYIRADPDEVLP